MTELQEVCDHNEKFFFILQQGLDEGLFIWNYGIIEVEKLSGRPDPYEDGITKEETYRRKMSHFFYFPLFKAIGHYLIGHPNIKTNVKTIKIVKRDSISNLVKTSNDYILYLPQTNQMFLTNAADPIDLDRFSVHEYFVILELV